MLWSCVSAWPGAKLVLTGWVVGKWDKKGHLIVVVYAKLIGSSSSLMSSWSREVSRSSISWLFREEVGRAMWGVAVLKKLNCGVGAGQGKREVTATGDVLLVRPPEGQL